jgi:phosphatidylinositol glycan class B
MKESKVAILIFSCLCLYRSINVLLIQTQFDPDEHWQTLEPAYCYAFKGSCALTWEWTRRAMTSASLWKKSLHGPLRSHLAILPTYIFYVVIKLLRIDTPFLVAKGPMLLHAALVAAPTDYLVWYLADHRSSSRWSLFCSLTSWFQAYTLVRTYSNSIETVLLMCGIALLRSKNTTNDSWAYVLGGMSVAIRFTSLAAWIPLGLLFALTVSSSFKARLMYLFNPCAMYGLAGFGLSLLVDRCFYGFWTIPLLANLQFNVVEGMGALYGSHPFHWYVTAGLPAITGLMLPILIFGVPRSKNNYLWAVILPYIFLHSISPHKEFRFLLPILPLLCIISGTTLAEEMNLFAHPTRTMLRAILIATFVIANLIAFLYLGLIHQRGPMDVNHAIIRRIQQLGHTDVSVHYLMDCHSTPLYSHLHVREGVNVQAWHLDCSPSCRASKSLTCESALFSRDPLEFVIDAYGQVCPIDHESDGDQGHVCGSPRTVPNFLAIFSNDAIKVEPQLASMGLVATKRFFHSIVGATLFGSDMGDTNMRTIRLASWLLLSGKEVVLYEQITH